MGLLSFLGFGSKAEKIKDFVNRKALVIDVRTKQEYTQGHLSHSVNIPLKQIGTRVKQLQAKQKPIITVCRSGARSAQAAALLRSNGLEVVNGGSWQSMKKYVRN